MTRWHLIRRGRIVASCECTTGDGAEAMLREPERDAVGQYQGGGSIISDAQWRGTMYIGALRRRGIQCTMQDKAEQLATQQGVYRVV